MSATAQATAQATGTGAALRAYVADLVATVGPARLAATVALVLASSVLDGLGLLLLVPLLELVNGQAATPALGWLLRRGLQPRLEVVLLAFVALMLVRAALSRRRERQMLTLRLDHVESLRRRLEHALAHAPWAWLAGIGHARVLHLLLDQLGRVNQGGHQLMQLLSGSGMALAGLAVAFGLAPGWTALLLLPLAVLVWTLRGRLAAAARMGAGMSQGQRAGLASARDFLAGLKLVKAHAAESRYLAEFEQRTLALRRQQEHFGAHQSSTRGRFEAGGAVLLAALLYGAATWGRLGLPQLLLIVLVFARLLPLLRDGQLQLQMLAHMLPAFVDLQDMIARCRAHAEPQAAAAGAVEEALPLQEALRLERVSFRHAEAEADNLHEVSLVLKARTTTALMGASGAGKTTLADIAAGLLPAASGEVRVDGRSLRDPQTLARWRRSVAYVAQDTVLIEGSVRDNLCWLGGPRSDEALWSALEQADAAGFVAALAGGLDHRLGERGEGLSGGERQRLALARALLLQPALLILDEVTSQLDPASEARVLAALGRLRGRVTVLMIAHRAAVAAQADRVVLIEGGRVLPDPGTGPAPHPAQAQR
jgi:ATP-binding cassette subfamily C protein